jgi:hypothetical protein
VKACTRVGTLQVPGGAAALKTERDILRAEVAHHRTGSDKPRSRHQTPEQSELQLRSTLAPQNEPKLSVVCGRGCEIRGGAVLAGVPGNYASRPRRISNHQPRARFWNNRFQPSSTDVRSFKSTKRAEFLRVDACSRTEWHRSMDGRCDRFYTRHPLCYRQLNVRVGCLLLDRVFRTFISALPVLSGWIGPLPVVLK